MGCPDGLIDGLSTPWNFEPRFAAWDAVGGLGSIVERIAEALLLVDRLDAAMAYTDRSYY